MTPTSVLEVIGRRILLVGGQGAGATMKLAVNDVVHATNQALAEALVLAGKAGVERETAYEVFASSAVTSPFVLQTRVVTTARPLVRRAAETEESAPVPCHDRSA